MPRRRRDPWLSWRGEKAYVCEFDPSTGHTRRKSLKTSDPLEARKRYARYLNGEEELVPQGSGVKALKVVRALDDYYVEHVKNKVVDVARAEDAIEHLKAWFKDLDVWRMEFPWPENDKDREKLAKENPRALDLADWFRKSTLSSDPPLTLIDIPTSRAYAQARRLGVIGGGQRRKNGAAGDATIRRELVVLGAAANHAAKWKRIGPKADPVTPMPSIELPPETRTDALGDDEWLTKDELRQVLDTATGRLKDFITIAYDSASRRAAVERMTVFQVDLAASRVNLRNPNETDNQRRSKKRRPVVPITAAARPTYERLVDETKNEWLFGSPADMYRPFRRHMESIGLGHKSNPHILRHSRATHLLQDGVPIFAVAKLLGDTVATVERVYGHHCPDYLGETMKEKLG